MFIKFLLALLYWLYIRLAGSRPKQLILYYHGVCDSETESFRKQIKYIAEYCDVVNLNLITDIPINNKPKIAITFDDAFENLQTNALPVLRKYNLPATIFVPAGNLGEKPRWEVSSNHPERQQMVMTEDQIISLEKLGFDIGSHTMTHPRLTHLSDDDLQAELEESKNQLEALLNHEIAAISYPHGDYDDRVTKAARKAGYKLGYTIEPRCVKGIQGKMTIPRFAVMPTDSIFKFKLIISGAWEVDYHLRKTKSFFKRLLDIG